ncbi:MAG: hypothetical protein JXQ29_05665 [Planctomycetes bacterium]|nr:hypothetical protein [Planctomycetota bacterium]
MNDTESRPVTHRLFTGVLILDAKVFGLALGILAALLVFVATNWLVIKGGEPVGPHLALLGQYFPGYRISLVGSLIGAGYALVLGTILGVATGWIYNRIAGRLDRGPE